MLNQVILVGKVTDIVKEKGKIKSLRVILHRRDSETVDKPKVYVSESLSEEVSKYLKDGNTVGVKARLETEDKGRYGTVTKVIVEKITFLSNSNE